MADWVAMGYSDTNIYQNGSRRDSGDSTHSLSSKNTNDGSTDDTDPPQVLYLNEGLDLAGESRTEKTGIYTGYENTLNLSSTGKPPGQNPSNRTIVSQGSSYGTAKARAAKSPFTAPPIESVPVEDFSIPDDANLSAFTSVQFANFLMCLKVDDKVVSHLHRKSVDGKRFAKMTDSELSTLGMNNPVVLFFKRRSQTKAKKKGPFML